MHQSGRFLVALDSDYNVSCLLVKKAMAYQQKFGYIPFFIHCINHATYLENYATTVGLDIEQVMHDQAKEYLSTVLAGEVVNDAQKIIITAGAVDGLVKKADELQVAFIMIGRHPSSHWHPGSITKAVIHYTKCDILSVTL